MLGISEVILFHVLRKSKQKYVVDHQALFRWRDVLEQRIHVIPSLRVKIYFWQRPQAQIWFTSVQAF